MVHLITHVPAAEFDDVGVECTPPVDLIPVDWLGNLAPPAGGRLGWVIRRCTRTQSSESGPRLLILRFALVRTSSNAIKAAG